MQVKFKKMHPNAVTPTIAKPGDAGLDLTAVSVEYDEAYQCIVYDTGIAIEIPTGFVGLVYCRSSIKKKNLFLTNHTGIIDSGYRGTIKFAFKSDIDYFDCPSSSKDFQEELNDGFFIHFDSFDDKQRNVIKYTKVYKPGDRVGQLIIMPYPQIELIEAEELSTTERGTGGYGHTGR